MVLNDCSCGGKAQMVMKLPKKKEICHVACRACGNSTTVFMAAYQAQAVWNSVTCRRK